MKKFFSVIGIIALAAVSFLIGTLTPERPEDAYNNGYAVGKTDGEIIGITSNAAYEYWFEQSFEDEYESAYRSGAAYGIKAGYLMGYNVGYEDRAEHINRAFEPEDVDSFINDGIDPFVYSQVAQTPSPTPRPTLKPTPKATPKPTTTPKSTLYPTKAPTPKPVSEDTQNYIVYITRTGKKYHRNGCQYLRQSKIEIDINDAKRRGYTACSRCW